MKKLILAALLALALAACGGHKPSVAACEQAMRQQFAVGMADPSSPAASRPKACSGVGDATLQQLASKILSGQ